MTQGVTCLVTIHGMGFQHAPQKGGQGYADGLHTHLQRHLPELGGDPVPEFGRPAGVGAVYVHSDWPPGSGKIEEGLKRLGVWRQGDMSHRAVDITHAPLVDERHRIAHVALVYAGLAEQQPHLGSTVETLARAVVAHGKYASLPSMVGMGVMDLWTAIKHQMQGPGEPTPSLHVRSKTAPGRSGVAAQPDPSDTFAVLRALDWDVTTYICRNDLRERVRSFAHDALLRLCFREDITSIVVNAHSQGTILAFDVLRILPPNAAAKVKGFVTAGSPLRKYADLFSWGTDAGSLCHVPWTNFWDDTDPVADPLIPPKEWRRGQALPPSPGYSELYQAIDQTSGHPVPVKIVDTQVTNVAHGASGSLAAHNYWANDDEFVKPLADTLQHVTSGHTG
jgi:hypothetical protein